jgi:hypothetical protein
MTAGKDTYEALWPRGRKRVTETGYAPRLKSLEGKTIAELWNWVFRGDEIFRAVEMELSRRYSGLKFINYKVFGSIHGSKESEVMASLPEGLKKNKCDAVITTTGC